MKLCFREWKVRRTNQTLNLILFVELKLTIYTSFHWALTNCTDVTNQVRKHLKTRNREDKEPQEEPQRRILLPGTDRQDVNITCTEQHDNNLPRMYETSKSPRVCRFYKSRDIWSVVIQKPLWSVDPDLHLEIQPRIQVPGSSVLMCPGSNRQDHSRSSTET